MGREPAETARAAAPAESGAGSSVSPSWPATAATAATAAAAAAATSGAMSHDRAGDIEFGLAVDVIYHRARAAWFDGCHRWAMFATIMMGSAAAADVFHAKACALLAAAFGALDLAFDLTTCAAQHRDLARDHLAIVAALHRGAFSEEACQAARDEEFRLSALVPAPYHALRDIAFNQAVTALGRDPNGRKRIGWVPHLLAQIWRFEGR